MTNPTTKRKSLKLGMHASCALLDPLIHVPSSSLLRRPLMNSSRISIPLTESTSSKGRCWYRSLPHAHAMLEISWAPGCCFTMPNHTEKPLCKWSSHQNDLPTVDTFYSPNCVSICSLPRKPPRSIIKLPSTPKLTFFSPEFAAPNSAARFGTTSAMAPKKACSDKASCAKAQAVPERP